MGSLVGGYPRYGTRKYCADEADVKWNPVKGSFTSEFVPEALAPEVTDLLSFHAQRLDRQIANQQRATQIRREDYTNRHISSRNIRRHGGQPYQGDTNGPHHRGRQPQGNGRRTRNTRPRNSSRISWPQGSRQTQQESGPTANTDRQPQQQVGPQPSNELVTPPIARLASQPNRCQTMDTKTVLRIREQVRAHPINDLSEH